MANQYKTGPAITEKCKAEGCMNKVRRTPSQVTSGLGKYCSTKCSTSQPRKFKDEDAMHIMLNLHSLKSKGLAAHYGISINTFYKLCNALRSKGWAIPMADGKVTQQKKFSSLTEDQKAQVVELYPVKSVPAIAEKLGVKAHVVRSCVEAYKRNQGKELKKKGKEVVHKRVATIDKRREHADRKPPVTPFKQKEPVFKTRKIETTGLIPVRFNDKNKTCMWARDEEHAARIRVTYGYLDKPLLAR